MTKRKGRRHAIVVFHLVGAIALGLVGCDESSDIQSLTLAHSLPVTHPVHKAMVRMQERLLELSEGGMRIDIYSDGQLGTERVILELLQIGSIDMTKVGGSTISSFAPEYKVLELPFLFRDRDHRFAVLEGAIGRRILDSGSKSWLRGLVFYDAGTRSFYSCTRPIRSPDDMRGMKVRVMSSPIAIEMIESMGAAATPISFGELYTALQQGIVDAAENNPPSYHLARHYEVCKYYTLDEHTAVPDVLLISTHAWDRLEAEQRAWLMEAARESAELQKVLWSEAEEQSLQTVAESGVEIIRPDREPFVERSRAVIDRFRSDPVLDDLISRIEQTVTE
ncbi:MAG: TRAP transporter substrate-binding protein [Rhodothermales bacterium]|nr:TRAP transporter substrate-binding protein [Rhodothermales bacterium]